MWARNLLTRIFWSLKTVQLLEFPTLLKGKLMENVGGNNEAIIQCIFFQSLLLTFLWLLLFRLIVEIWIQISYFIMSLLTTKLSVYYWYLCCSVKFLCLLRSRRICCVKFIFDLQSPVFMLAEPERRGKPDLGISRAGLNNWASNPQCKYSHRFWNTAKFQAQQQVFYMKGTVSRDFRPLVFFSSSITLQAPESSPYIFSKLNSKGHWHEKKCF
jgi:hypothetical protein